jgi:hypothetical protein
MQKKKLKNAPKSSPTRSASVAAARAKEPPEERREKASRAARSGTPEERAERARKAGLASAAKRAQAKARSEAARKGWETRRAAAPEKYQTPPKRPSKAQKKKARSEAARKGWQTRRQRAAEREALAARYREQLERNRAQWQSDLVYVTRPGGATIGTWVTEAVDLARQDAAGAGANPLAGPWRAVGSVEGAREGAGTFDVILTGTITERAAALAAAVGDASRRGGISKENSPDRKGGAQSGGGRAARPMDAAAQAERDRALVAFGGAQKEPAQSARITSLIAPLDSPVWRPVDEEPEEPGDDEIPF